MSKSANILIVVAKSNVVVQLCNISTERRLQCGAHEYGIFRFRWGCFSWCCRWCWAGKLAGALGGAAGRAAGGEAVFLAAAGGEPPPPPQILLFFSQLLVANHGQFRRSRELRRRRRVRVLSSCPIWQTALAIRGSRFLSL